ncbi:aspartyl-phosphate phosphatase Spo0E family protein [Aquibacillus halophilus]|uniref:aspartyl-phosphate phosphatase Spo0E family protein n=1 Tax=Aquibacillus halophilus TaxID=930132 RepID=UPI001479603B|nr:aspartyl-phosphate phosphatase Spo0E family protein [Aquibacillus halophilus]
MTQTKVREKKMEILRLEMYRCYQENRDSEEVIKVSQELDKLLNAFLSLPSKDNGLND